MNTIDVIIPVQNMAALLDDALTPIIDQLATGDGLTVVNDASTDKTEAVARELGAAVINLAESKGPYFARQVAAERSQADILLFIDGRSRALPGLVEAHRRMHDGDGIALSCTELRTRSGPALATRVAAMRGGMSLRTMVDAPGRPPISRPRTWA